MRGIFNTTLPKTLECNFYFCTMKYSNDSERKGFRSSFGVLVALAGSAVGLGNMWRFPYLMGTNGGAAFIIIYVVSILLVALPIMTAEMIIGRRGHSNPVGSFNHLSSGSKVWRFLGLLMVLAPFFILCFYGVVGGWTVDYLFRSLTVSFSGAHSEAECSALFADTMSSPIRPLVFMLIFMATSALIICAGVQKGIERYSKILMPVLFLIIVLMAAYVITLPGASEGLDFMFRPDFSKVTGSTCLAALGQSFFSLSLGAGTVLTYSSYMRKDQNISRMSVLTAFSDTCFAIFAGAAIIPAVFAFGFSPSEGPGLVFVVLPAIFSKMTGGSLVAIAFFFSLFIAAITSFISLMEVVAACLSEELGLSRKKSAAITMAFGILVGVFCSLSCGPLQEFKLFGKTIFDLFDYTSSNILMTLGGLAVVIFAGWWMKREDYFDEVTSSGAFIRPIHKWFYFFTKYVAPIAIIVIMIFGFIG